MPALELPSHIGPCEFGMLGKQVTVRCPEELAHILRRAGAVWEPARGAGWCSGGVSGR